MTKKYFTTLRDYVEQEVLPALDGAEAEFDVDGIVADLRDKGFVFYVPGKGFTDLAFDEDGEYDESAAQVFWDTIATHDQIDPINKEN